MQNSLKFSSSLYILFYKLSSSFIMYLRLLNVVLYDSCFISTYQIYANLFGTVRKSNKILKNPTNLKSIFQQFCENSLFLMVKPLDFHSTLNYFQKPPRNTQISCKNFKISPAEHLRLCLQDYQLGTYRADPRILGKI